MEPLAKGAFYSGAKTNTLNVGSNIGELCFLDPLSFVHMLQRDAGASDSQPWEHQESDPAG